ncbi:MAG: lamin tail domain-containing protein [Clostridia bacterium]|nr:lamin tail domain-containing protein [Clostridia bacterium]
MKQSFSIKTILTGLLAAILLLASIGCTGEWSDAAVSGPSIVINEVVTSNGESFRDDVLGSPDWIELKNVGTGSVSLLGYRITDNIQKTEKAFVLPDVTLAPGEFLLLLATKEQETDLLSYEGGPICIGFSLKQSGENLALEDANLQLIQELTVPELRRDVSFARMADGSYGYCAEPTPLQENDTTLYATIAEVPSQEEAEQAQYTPQQGIVFSEVSARNNEAILCAGCAGCDWVELFNTTGEAIDLNGFALTDDEGDFDKPNLDVTIPAYGYLLILCCSSECNTDDGHICVRMGISRYGDHLFLFDQHGLLCAEVEFGETPHKDMTWARDTDGSYRFTATSTPNAENVFTDYVEEDPNEEKADDPEAIYTGLNSKVILNEALASNSYSIADRDGDRSDWVELYNTTDSAVDLNGWYLTDSKDWTKWTFPAVSIPANGYLLIFLDGKESVGNELHASFSLSEGETLKLYDPNTNTYDQLVIAQVRSNVSIGRDSAGTIVYYGEPTPLAPNGHARSEADSFGFFQSDGVYISEVCAIHERGSGEDDWVELHNGGEEAVSLNGYYLTDDIDQPTKYRIASLLLEAGDYASVSVSKYSGSFSVSPSGETIYLLKPDGQTVIDTFETGVQRVGMSSGRIESDPTVRRVFYHKPTKGKENGGSYEVGYTSEPTFSETALYRTNAFSLTLSDLQTDATIYYTTDGSEPSKKSNRYTGPIPISQNSVIRAYAVSDGLMDSEIITYTYLFEEPHTVPVVCISMAPADFKTVWNVKEHKNIKERKGFVSYYESDGGIGTSFPCDIKAKGRGTLTYISQRSLTLGLRAAYGQRTVDYPFFDDYPFREFGAFALRQAGQDYDMARMRDAYVSRACIGLNVDCANSRCVVVYINGAYYGVYDFNEELNSRYLETHYGVDSDTVNTIMRNGATAMKGTNTDFKKIFNSAKNLNLSDDAKYQDFLEQVDEDYFIDYVICRTFMLETDTFNQKYWRTTDYKLKWRPILYDLDYCFMSSATRDIMHLYFNKAGQASAHGSMTYFYFTVALKTNESFRKKFVERYVEVVMTQFSAETLLELFDRVVAEYEPEMQRHIARWGHPKSYSAWQKEVASLRNKIEQRPSIVLEQVRKEFKYSQADMDALIAKYSG